MQNNPQLNFEKHTPPSEISQAANAAYAVMLAAVHNADLGLIPQFSNFNKPAQRYEEPPVEEDSYTDYADFEAYRRRNQQVQPEQVAVVPETSQADMLRESDDLERIRSNIDAVHAEMAAEQQPADETPLTPAARERHYLDDRHHYDQEFNRAA